MASSKQQIVNKQIIRTMETILVCVLFLAELYICVYIIQLSSGIKAEIYDSHKSIGMWRGERGRCKLPKPVELQRVGSGLASPMKPGLVNHLHFPAYTASFFTSQAFWSSWHLATSAPASSCNPIAHNISTNYIYFP